MRVKILTIGLIISSLIFSSCEKELVTKKEQIFSKEISDNDLTEKLTNYLDFFEELKLKNEVTYVKINDTGDDLDVIYYEIEQVDPNHTFSSFEKIVFVTLCKDQLKRGRHIKIGYDENGYWANIKSYQTDN